MLGALSFVRTAPGAWTGEYELSPSGIWSWFWHALDSQFTALPIQIYNWASQPDDIFRRLAAASIVVLLVVLLSMNALATGIRAWQQRHKTW
jgi:ABC-type phosphate transport system permease subunit